MTIIRWLADGKTARDISDIQGIKYHTVNNYIRDAFVATGTIKSASLVAMALRKGWIV
jgi:DNA-binding CsgD family transcriptional regulator